MWVYAAVRSYALPQSLRGKTGRVKTKVKNQTPPPARWFVGHGCAAGTSSGSDVPNVRRKVSEETWRRGVLLLLRGATVILSEDTKKGPSQNPRLVTGKENPSPVQISITAGGA